MGTPTPHRIVLVTGASSGIGAALVRRLATTTATPNPWTVFGASRRGTVPEDIPRLRGIKMDVDDDAAVELGIDQILADHGRLDAVVCNAGWGLAGPVETTPVDDAKSQFETNFFGAVRVVRTALPHLRQAASTGSRARIVLVSSIGGVIGIPFQAYYSASKFALEGFGEALAYEVAPFGVDVTLVEPGNVRTDFTAVRRTVTVPDDTPYAKASRKAIDLMVKGESHGIEPGDVARVVQGLLTGRRPPRRISVGKVGERIGLPAKRLLPHRLFELGAKSSLGV